MTDVFDSIVGQDAVVGHLRAAARSPVHAYLFEGPPGTGRRRAAMAFAAALVCPNGGCGSCDACDRATAALHPDVVVVEREGSNLGVEQAREIRRLAMRTPNEAGRKVLVVPDLHLAQEAVAVLLKVVEEPPPSTVFAILADHVPRELVTIASRCVRIEFGALSIERLVEMLLGEGVDADVAARAAEASGGRLDRARLLASDPGFADRRAAWSSIGSRLDGTGATVAVIVDELVKTLDKAAVEPLTARHDAELAELDERVRVTGERGSGRKALADRHRREMRRLRTDELRWGLAIVAAAYRDAMVTNQIDVAGAVAAVDALQSTSEALGRNPSEALMLQALLVRLPPLRATARAPSG